MIAAVRALVEQHALLPHPEGGYYREIFRSPHNVVDGRGRVRSALTVILYLLEGGDVSRWHRLGSDETWHFARGSPVAIDCIDDAGTHREQRLASGGPWQATVPAGDAFAARVLEPDGYALVTCCVAPGFEFEDFEMLDPGDLARRFPQHRELIARYG